MPHPVARDDEGKIVQTVQPEGPPPLFPVSLLAASTQAQHALPGSLPRVAGAGPSACLRRPLPPAANPASSHRGRLPAPDRRTAHDKLAWAVHAYLLAEGFKLVATGAAAEDEASGAHASPCPALPLPAASWRMKIDPHGTSTQ